MRFDGRAKSVAGGSAKRWIQGTWGGTRPEGVSRPVPRRGRSHVERRHRIELRRHVVLRAVSPDLAARCRDLASQSPNRLEVAPEDGEQVDGVAVIHG